MARSTTLTLTAYEVAFLYGLVSTYDIDDSENVATSTRRVHRQLLAKVTAALIATQKPDAS